MREESTVLTLLLLRLDTDRGRLSLDSSGRGRYFCGRKQTPDYKISASTHL